MISKCISFLVSKKEKINHFLVYFLLIYMVLLLLPYVFARVRPLDAFFTSGISQIIYRGLTSAFALVYLLLLAIVNEVKINKIFSICGAILLTSFVISCIVSPHTLYKDDGSLFVSISWWTYLLGSLRIMTIITMFVLLISVIHQIIDDMRIFYLSLYILVGIVFIACIFTFIVEGSAIVKLMNGGDEHSLNIRSIFHSKNEFGMMLLIASIASTFIIFYNSDNVRYYIFCILLFLFTNTAILTGCRTAFISCIVLIIYLFVGLSIASKIKKKHLIIGVSIFSIIVISFILYMLVPVLHRAPANWLYNVVNYTFARIGTAFLGRVEIWEDTFSFMNGTYLVFGANTTNSIYLLLLHSSHNDFHSGYIKWFATTGIIGSIIYLTLFTFFIYF